ncbi:MAG: carbonic anhydrase family protein [Aquabacterium sp.]
MHFKLKAWLAPTCDLGVALVASMALVVGAQASGAHGDPEEEAKPAATKPLPRLSESRLPAREAESSARSGKSGAGEAREVREGAAAASEARASVSMTELRDMIDKKIAEVRTQREATPVVRLRPKAKPQKKSPEDKLASAGATHDAHGALLPAGAAADPHGGHGIDPMGRDVHWAYGGATGPEQWGRLKPEFQTCMLGKRQSPIDIRDGIPVQLDPIQFDYRPSGFRVIDNGHTVQVNVEPGNGIIVQGRRYELIQFHFHRPSEERINGRQYEMVAHLVHKDLDGRLAVVAVLMDAGKSHPVVQLVWNNLPLEKQTEQAALVQMDLNQLLPEQRQYYTYMGSLTTPPCTEGVLWMVMKHPSLVSREQIGVFSKLYQMNARPIQPASGRLIKDGQ